LFDELMTQASFREGKRAVNHRPDLSTENALHNVKKFTRAAHCGSEHLNLTEEDLSKIRLRSKTGSRSAR